MGFTGRKQQPGWGTMMGRQFGMGLLNLVPQVAGNVLMSGIRDAFKQKEEARRNQALDAERRYQEDLADMQSKERQAIAQGRAEAAAREKELAREHKDIGTMAEELSWEPEEQAKVIGAGKQYQAPATQAIGETLKRYLPRFVGGSVSAMSSVPFTAAEPEEAPEAVSRSVLEKRMGHRRRAAETGVEKAWEPPKKFGGLGAGQPGALASMGTGAMLGKAFEPKGTMEGLGQEVGIVQRGAPEWAKKPPSYFRSRGFQFEPRAKLAILKDTMQQARDARQFKRLQSLKQLEGDLRNILVQVGKREPGTYDDPFDTPEGQDVMRRYAELVEGKGGEGGGGGPATPYVAPPPGVTPAKWKQILRESKQKYGKTPQQVREAWRKKHGK